LARVAGFPVFVGPRNIWACTAIRSQPLIETWSVRAWREPDRGAVSTLDRPRILRTPAWPWSPSTDRETSVSRAKTKT